MLVRSDEVAIYYGVHGGEYNELYEINKISAQGARRLYPIPDTIKQRSPEISLKASENGGYLLSHKRSTIGVAELNDPVRNGKGWDLSAITT